MLGKTEYVIRDLMPHLLHPLTFQLFQNILVTMSLFISLYLL